MAPPKVVSLDVRAAQVAHLCFEVGGILGEFNVELGSPAPLFDFPAFYGILGGMPTVPGHPARLLYDFLEVQAAVKPFTLAALRAEAGKAALSKAVNARANAFYSKYANGPAVIAQTQQSYSPSVIGSKPNRLEVLASFSQQQMEAIRDAYLAGEGLTDVWKTTKSIITSTTTAENTDKTIDLPATAGTISNPPATSTLTTQGTHQSHVQLGSSSADQSETIENTDFGYRHPHFENLAQYERAQISLIDEQFAQFMDGQTLPFLAAVFTNELNSIDSDVFRAQVAYLSTILMSPIAGTVTGVYKGPGEAVAAGEPVVRVENNAEILLVAVLVFRGQISIGSSISVETTLFDAAGPNTVITGQVVAVRGQQEDNQWEVIAKCNNIGADGKPIFPLGYHFDYDNTFVTIT